MTEPSLNDLIRQDLHNTEELSILLERERKGLEVRDLGELELILADKARVLADMEKNAQAREEILSSAGCSNDRQGIEHYCAGLAEANSHSERDSVADFEALQQAVSQCQNANSLNGAVVHRSRVSSKRVLDILKGHLHGSALYTSVGDTEQHHESGSIGTA